MSSLLVYEILQNAQRLFSKKAAVHDVDGTISFEELFTQTESLRQQLLQQGIKAGMGVGLKAQNGRNFIIALFAIAGTGAVAVPIHHQIKQPELDALLQEAPLHAILFDGNGLQPLSNAVSLTVEVQQLKLGFTGVAINTVFASHIPDAAFMRFTSGTTGKSKGVIISHQSVVDRIEAANKALQLGPDDTVVWALPMAFHFVVSIVLYIRFGVAIAVAKDFLAPTILDITNRYNGTLLYASPILIRLLSGDKTSIGLSSLHTVISTSEGISADVCNAFAQRYGIAVSQAYGIIEIGLPIINKQQNWDYPDAVGYAVSGYTVDILDDALNPLPAGTTGHLAIKGPGMFDGYLSPAQFRNEVLQNGYFLTADYASKNADGLIKIEGRKKSVINVSGSKVFPEEVEAVLETMEEIQQAKISSIPHPLFGQLIVAELIAAEGYVISQEKVMAYCRQRLSPFKIPQQIKIVEELPMTATGKLRR